eukprot:CAMPEP_0182533426 /NCGR_PEP_ID=MMETSP1323-20130603/13675_1 /TAXON_ID=236787 /ORGANISM="Florenciella parvula, Strain RCC1693" /LENGTH=239 /DNA_ID=CAMNT_0024743305 /DNA_START=44 /DNA_END=763 /DNA_ORIENTATION=-
MAALETPEVDLTAAIAAALPYSLDLAELNKEKEVPDDKKTYDNFKGLNSAVPDLSTLKFIKGEAPEEPTTGPIVILTWAKYAKGDYRTMVHFSFLMRALPGLRVVGVSCDPAEEDATAMLKKMDTPMPTQSIDLLVFDMSLAFDEGKKVKDAIVGAVGGSLAPGRALLYIDGELKWQEQFTAGWALKDGQFGEQCALALAGEPLIANGEPPAEEEGDEDEEEAVVGGDFVDPMAGGGDY